MPKYMALICQIQAQSPDPTSPEFQKLAQAYGAFNEDATQAGVLTPGVGLQPAAMATTIRVREGKPLLTDGPFAETKEQLAGYCFLECKDLDEALRWAARIPDAATGAIEVRPVQEW